MLHIEVVDGVPSRDEGPRRQIERHSLRGNRHAGRRVFIHETLGFESAAQGEPAIVGVERGAGYVCCERDQQMAECMSRLRVSQKARDQDKHKEKAESELSTKGAAAIAISADHQ